MLLVALRHRLFVQVSLRVLLWTIYSFLKDVGAQNVPTYRFFKLATQKGNDLLLLKRPKEWGGGVTDLVLQRTSPEEHSKSEKMGQ